MNRHSFNRIRDKIVLVTGASSGIGEAVCREAARRGARVVMVARRAAELARIGGEIRRGGGTADWISADLTDEEDVRRLLDELHRRYGHIDILVSNAGSGWYGPVWEMSWDSAQSLIELNVVATARLALALLPEMVAARRGHLIVIGSIAGSLPVQGIAIYAATKAFLESYCRSVYRETRRTGVAVSLVKPGAVITPFFDAARRDGGRRIPFSRHGISAQHVARRVVGLMRRPRRQIYVPFYLRLVPLVEMLFGWVLDGLGPILLRRKSQLPNHRPAHLPGRRRLMTRCHDV
ncbi:MAG: SDR family NAD(P)-dependent oxidoreductase [Spirochaetaceae bacterium]|nr:SDR family NAD(P)-dependent oxidoreductase [Spirochaetaceae bacterium]